MLRFGWTKGIGLGLMQMAEVGWAKGGTTLGAAFLASLVEFVEALTVVLAVGSVRGWRSAIAGCTSAVVLLAAVIAFLGPALTHIPLYVVQLGIGTLILLFGLRWLRKAILRSAGLIPMHDEAAAFAQRTAVMRSISAKPKGLDKLAFVAAFNITMLEGTEVVFIVVALGAGGIGLLMPAMVGALAALLVVIALGTVLHRPLTRVPENTLKFIVGLLLSAFGTFWVGEGAGFAWSGSDLAIPVLVVAYFGVAVLLVRICQRTIVVGG